MVRFILGLTLAGLLNAVTASAGPIIYGSRIDDGAGPSTLYNISPGPGPVVGPIGVPIGPIGFMRVGALDFSPTGTLYGVGFIGPTADTAFLITIDTTTGAGTPVGPLGVNGQAFNDIAFRPSDGTLFAFSIGLVYTLDTATGAATFVGNAGVGNPVTFPPGSAIAFLGGTLFYAGGNVLYTINQASGLASPVLSINFQPAFGAPSPRSPGMKVDPATGILWALVTTGGGFFGAAPSTSLGTIDPSTGQTTFVAALPSRMDGIAVIGVAAVPTLSEWAQIVLVSVLILVGLEALRRRRTTSGATSVVKTPA